MKHARRLRLRSALAVLGLGAAALGANVLLDPDTYAVAAIHARENWTPLPDELEPWMLASVVRIGNSRYAPLVREQWSNEVEMAFIEALMLDWPPKNMTAVARFYREMTGADLRADMRGRVKALWAGPTFTDPFYARFKEQAYTVIDPSFAEYFAGDPPRTIRFEEIFWGGVKRDGIPPLHNPAMLAAADAGYLADTDVVFGIEVDGDARAYPKRILAWHEMFTDTVGGVSLAGVYCTLCGTVIVYETEVDGVRHELGTSGFLYRSNKLMYDRATMSLWSTMEGTPVVGPLVGKGIELPERWVVTTTWGEWRRRHPDTTVLSVETGHARDYSEGAAYRDYFASDELMFPVPTDDTRLANKAEVLSLEVGPGPPLAIAAARLADEPLFAGEHGGVSFLVLTDASGANRVYESRGGAFQRGEEGFLVDAEGAPWTVSEEALEGPGGRRLARLPAHRAFWFGWKAAFPEGILIE
ncbi:MAG: DUF3179 domain-containing protein [Candidatus Sumerlaeia bacterium]|nr:DUF3179 domain-containing protein [Candidatus Sumerlaeia bacterium]